jgi:hypothetical protein
MRAAALVLLALIGATGVRAQAPSVDRAEISWAGIYRGQIVGTVDQPGTASGKTNQLANIVKLETTTTVRARLGTSFGFEYRLEGAPEGAAAAVKIVVVLPKAGLFNPVTKQRTHREEWRPAPSMVGGASLAGYLMERDWEIVPGIWKFEIWHDGRKLGEQAFCVVSDGAPDPDAGEQEKDEPCHSAATA